MASNVDEDADIDVDAERRLQSFILGLKQQADQLMMSDKFDDAIRLYRGLLVHLTKSQVKMATQKDIVISCRMNVLAGLSKLEKWQEIPGESEHVLQFINDIKADLEKTMPEDQFKAMQAQILGRVFYFRGFALLKLGAFAQADHDFRIAMQMLPNVDAIKEDWKQVQGALFLENRVKELMNTAMGHFQSDNYDVAVETCEAALVEANKLQKPELTALIHGNLAAACARAEKDDAALKHFNLAIVLTKQLDETMWSDRLFDLLESVTSIHMRRNDAEAAYGMLQQSLAVFPKCKERQAREHIFLSNVGRVCLVLQKFDEAERHLRRAEKAAENAEGRLQVLALMGKAYAEQKMFDKLETLVDQALVLTVKEQRDDLHAMFLQLWLVVMEAKAASGKKEPISELDLAKLAAGYQFFAHKRLLNGLLRAALLLLAGWGDTEEHRASREEVLNSLDAIKIEGLLGHDAELLGRLGVIRADVLVARGEFAKALSSLADVIKCIAVEKSTDEVRHLLLRRLAELCVLTETSDDDTLARLEQSLAVLRGEPKHVAVLSSTLVRVAQWKTRTNVVAAEALLAESEALLKEYEGENVAELKCQTLVGACVLQLKRGNVAKAKDLMAQIDAHAFAKQWMQLDVIRQQLSKGDSVKAEPKQKKSTEPTKTQPAPVNQEVGKKEEETVDATATIAVATPPLTGLAAWWDEYWFAVSVVLVGIIFAYVVTRDEEQQPASAP